jgi:hypothetical protein
MMYMLINAVQEQQEMISEQSKMIEVLAAELAALKKDGGVVARK